MFDKMTKREKTLAAVVGALAPLAIVFMALMWFIGSYNSNEVAIQGLQRDIRTQKDKIDARDRANLRKKYYESISFPTDMSAADVDYGFWLRKVVEKDVKLQFQGLTRVEGVQVKYNQDVVYKQRGYKLTAKGTLDQLTKFMYEFYSLPMMHRINKVNITPRTAGTVGEKKLIRTGEHSFIIGIDVVAVSDASESRDFINDDRIPLERTLQDYDEKIVFRNIFGPANNTPTVEASLPGSIYPETEIKFSLTGKDADENDLLTYELVDCKIPDAKIVVSDPESRRAQFVAPGLPLGEHEFKLRVSDSGYPPKTSTTDVKLAIVKRPNARPSFVTDDRLEVIAGQPVKFSIEASDTDAEDQLTFEIMESDFEEGKLVPGENGKVEFEAPPKESGRYRVKMKVTDNGETPKFAIRSFTVSVNPPEFMITSQTQVTGILSSRKGDMCWINVRPTGAFYKLVVGETFEIDSQEWKVDSINVAKSTVWLSHGDKLKRYRPDDFLNKPREEKAVGEEIVSKPVSKKESPN